MSMLHSMSMLYVNVNVHWHIYCTEMLECRTVRHPVSPIPDWKKLTMPKPVRYWTKLTQSGIFLVRYQTIIRDAGMPMPALVSSMPMPSYGKIPPWKRFPLPKNKSRLDIILYSAQALRKTNFLMIWGIKIQIKGFLKIGHLQPMSLSNKRPES